jgi:hypothetical protein
LIIYRLVLYNEFKPDIVALVGKANKMGSVMGFPKHPSNGGGINIGWVRCHPITLKKTVSTSLRAKM